MKNLMRILVMVVSVVWSVEAKSKIILEPVHPGKVAAACHYLDNGQVKNDFLTFFTDTGEVWFGDIFSGARKLGQITFANERFIATQVTIKGGGVLFYFASVLIDIESRKYLKSEIRQIGCSTLKNCKYEATAFEGKCQQIIGRPQP